MGLRRSLGLHPLKIGAIMKRGKGIEHEISLFAVFIIDV